MIYNYKYSRQTQTLEISRETDGGLNRESIAFLQGDEANSLSDQLEKCETAEIQDYILSQYDLAS